MARAQVAKERENAWLAVLLSWVAGGVDAIGFIRLFHLFTAHMSGNTAGFGAYLGQGNGMEALRRFFPIPVFVVGVALGAAIVEIARRRRLRSAFSLALGIEAALLVGFIACGRPVPAAGTTEIWGSDLVIPAVLLALAMGMQNATLRQVGSAKIRTTYITGMLTDFAEEAVAFLFWMHDHTRRRTAAHRRRALQVATRQVSLARMALHAGIWLGYVTGAVIGGVATTYWRSWAMGIPLAGLGLVIVLDIVAPLSAPERRGPVRQRTGTAVLE